MSESDIEDFEWDRELRCLRDTEEQRRGESARKAAARLNNLRPSPVSEKLSQHVQALYDSGAKIWTKDTFLKLEKELVEEPRSTVFMIRGMNGGSAPRELPEADENRIPEVRFTIYQELFFNTQLIFSKDSLEKNAHVFTREIDTELTRDIVTCGLGVCWDRKKTSSDTGEEYPLLQDAWLAAKEDWTDSCECAELLDMLEYDIEIPQSAKRIVCFGLGNLDHGDPLVGKDEHGRPISLTQHAAALTMAAAFGEALGTDPLPVLAQDPGYSPMSIRLLTEVGIEVVTGCGSLGFTHVDEDTIVFSCSPGIPVKQIVADIAKPAAMIWNTVSSKDSTRSKWKTDKFGLVSPWIYDQDSPRTRALVKDYERHDFPAYWGCGGGLKLYVRKD